MFLVPRLVRCVVPRDVLRVVLTLVLSGVLKFGFWFAENWCCWKPRSPFLGGSWFLWLLPLELIQHRAASQGMSLGRSTLAARFVWSVTKSRYGRALLAGCVRWRLPCRCSGWGGEGDGGCPVGSGRTRAAG